MMKKEQQCKSETHLRLKYRSATDCPKIDQSQIMNITLLEGGLSHTYLREVNSTPPPAAPQALKDRKERAGSALEMKTNRREIRNEDAT